MVKLLLNFSYIKLVKRKIKLICTSSEISISAIANYLKMSWLPLEMECRSSLILVRGLQMGTTSGSPLTQIKPAPLVLNGKELPWVQSVLHLGHVLHEPASIIHGPGHQGQEGNLHW